MAVHFPSEPTSDSDSDSNRIESENAVRLLEIVTLIRNDIQQRTNGSIRDLEVSLHEGLVTVTGRTSRYYYKQLATSAVFDVTDDLDLQNSIAVH